MTRQIDADAVINAVRLAQQAGDPASPAAGYWLLYTKSGGAYIVDSSGNVYGLRIANDAIWDAAGDMVYASAANTGAKLTIGTAGQFLQVNSGATAPAWSTGGRVLINEASPTGTTVTWDSIPGGYNSLEIELMGRTDRASNPNEGIYLHFNNDTTETNYFNQNLSGTGTTASATEADDSNVLVLPAATATASYSGYSLIRVPDYDGTTYHKIARIFNARREAASDGFTGSRVMFWESTSAITRVDLVTVNSGNFVAGTKARLYGIY